MNKKPSFQFYTGDWLKDPGVRRLSPREKGVYIELLILLFDSGGYTQKMTETELMMALNFRSEDGEETREKVDSVFHRVLERLKACEVIHQTEDGRLYNKRILRDLEEKDEISQKRSEAGKLGNQKRWQTHRKCDNVCDNTCDDSEIANESQEAKEKNRLSTSTSISNNINKQQNAGARTREGHMPKDPEEAVELCFGKTEAPPDFIRQAYFQAAALDFQDGRGNQIRNWPAHVQAFWINSQNKERKEQARDNARLDVIKSRESANRAASSQLPALRPASGVIAADCKV